MFIALTVGNHKVSQVSDDDFIKSGKASLDLRKEFRKKVPFSLICTGKVDGETHIIAAVNLAKGIPVLIYQLLPPVHLMMLTANVNVLSQELV